VGKDKVAVIDPGPDVADHVRALVSAVRDASERMIVLTHGHRDHAGATRELADAIGAAVWGPEGVEHVGHLLVDGDAVETDEGQLVAVHTPGHTSNHLCFYWPERRALFAGDMLLGRGDTTWVAEYPGCVADYFESIERLRELDISVVYPAHGPPLENVAKVLDRFARHRRIRVRQVEHALIGHEDATPEQLFEIVYGGALPKGMEEPARLSLAALMEYVRGRDQT
jgi:glyoxylase-like metal-dependent hydrolase (beta-lactamase superfamily II)